MAEIKGILLHGWMMYLNENHGEPAVKRAIQQLEPKDRALVGTGVFLAASWYPYEANHALRNLTRILKPAADKQTAVDIGRSTAWHAFSNLAQSRIGDPIDRVTSFTKLSEGNYRDVRVLESEVTGPASCVVRYRYMPGVVPTRAICASLIGFWTCVLEMMGATRVVSTHPRCVLNSDTLCEFTFSWTAPPKSSTAVPLRS